MGRLYEMLLSERSLYLGTRWYRRCDPERRTPPNDMPWLDGACAHPSESLASTSTPAVCAVWQHLTDCCRSYHADRTAKLSEYYTDGPTRFCAFYEPFGFYDVKCVEGVRAEGRDGSSLSRSFCFSLDKQLLYKGCEKKTRAVFCSE